MKANNITDEQLLDYLDGNLNHLESEAIDKLIKSNPDVKSRWEELQQVDNMLANMSMKSPSNFFVADVMKSLDKAHYDIKKGGFLIAIGAIITVLFGAYFTVRDMIDLSIIQQEDYFHQFNQFLPETINLETLNTFLLGMLSLFALLIIDKAVLKPFFQKRKYHY